MRLSEGWYPQYAVVDSESSDFKLVVEWVKNKVGITEDPAIIAQPFEMPYTVPASPLAPHELIFALPNGVMTSVDAVQTFYFPEVSVIHLLRLAGLPVVNPGKYKKPEPPPAVVEPPKPPSVLVGDPLPGTAGWYGVVAGDDSPDGTIYEDGRGRFVKVVKQTPFGKSQYWRLIKFN